MVVAQQYVAYFRVSTEEQGESGLGIEAQQKKVRSLVESRGGEIVAEFTEIESGRKNKRPEERGHVFRIQAEMYAVAI